MAACNIAESYGIIEIEFRRQAYNHHLCIGLAVAIDKLFEHFTTVRAEKFIFFSFL